MKTAKDFEVVYWPGNICTLWDCGKQGSILAYDDFSPEFAHWFCSEHWPEYEELLIIVEDTRVKPA